MDIFERMMAARVSCKGIELTPAELEFVFAVVGDPMILAADNVERGMVDREIIDEYGRMVRRAERKAAEEA